MTSHWSESGGGRSIAIWRLERDARGLCETEFEVLGTDTRWERRDRGVVCCAGALTSISSFFIELVTELFADEH